MWDVFERLFKKNYFNVDHRQSVIDEFESLYQGSMTVTNFYIMELTQYAWARARDTPTLIVKFRKWLQPAIFDKLVGHRFTSLVDCYAVAQQAEASLEMRNVECNRACPLSGGDKRKMTHKGGGKGWLGQGQHSSGSS